MDLWLRVLSLMVLLVLDDRGVLDEYRITVSRVGNYQAHANSGKTRSPDRWCSSTRAGNEWARDVCLSRFELFETVLNVARIFHVLASKFRLLETVCSLFEHRQSPQVCNP